MTSVYRHSDVQVRDRKSHLDSTSGLLSLADGMTWRIAADDEISRKVVDRLAAAMRLLLGTAPGEREIRVRIVDRSEGAGPGRVARSAVVVKCESERLGGIELTLDESPSGDGLVRGLLRLASVIAVEAIRNGGVLIHGGLAVWRGMGVVLAGPSGVGKSTACRRLPESWDVLSDDAALLVRGPDGGAWAHPWPTWGAVFSEARVASWEVGRAVPLKAICFLSQSGHDAAQRIREGEAVCLAVETVEQLLPTLTKGLSEDEKRFVRMQQFQNLCALLSRVQAYYLGVQRHGRFWEALQAALMSETLQASSGMER